jgi:drug/metabolite transporter (DMT)-like permease
MPSAPAAPASDVSRFILGAFCVIATVTIWAGWLVLIRFGVTTTTLNVPDLVALRFAAAGPILLPVLLRRGFALDRLGWTGLLAVALGGGAPYALVVGAGLVFAPVAHASALTQGVLPLTIGLVAAVILRERLSPLRLLGFGLIVAGALAIAGIGLASLASRESIGHALFLGATLLWAGYTVAIRYAQLDGLHAAAIAAVTSFVFYLPIYLFFYGDRLLAAPIGEIALQAFYQGVLTAVVSLVLFGRGVALLGATGAGAFIALGPIIAALMAIPALGEWPKPTDWLGIAVISAGVYIASGALTLSARSPAPRP